MRRIRMRKIRTRCGEVKSRSREEKKVRGRRGKGRKKTQI